MLAAVEHRGGLRYVTPGAPATLAGRNRSGAAPAVALGQDTEEVLADRIGLSGGEIARLFDEGLAASPKGRI
jgi:2-methylfumaryl-CoA isomerase